MSQEGEYRREITACFEADDWLGAHRWAKGWIGSGGGARSVEPWLVYVACDLGRRQPRGAVRAVDLGLKHWIRGRAARAVLLYVRGEVIRRHVRDPKTALEDLRDAESAVPDWLREDAAAALAACDEEAPASRKRKRSVDPAPSYSGRWLAGSGSVKRPPPLWEPIHEIIKR